MKVYFVNQEGQDVDVDGKPSDKRVYVLLETFEDQVARIEAASLGRELPETLVNVIAIANASKMREQGFKRRYDDVTEDDIQGLIDAVTDQHARAQAEELANALRKAVTDGDHDLVAAIIWRLSSLKFVWELHESEAKVEPVFVRGLAVRCGCGVVSPLSAIQLATLDADPAAITETKVEYACECGRANLVTINVGVKVARYDRALESPEYQAGYDDYENDLRPQSDTFDYLCGYEDAQVERGRCYAGKYTAHFKDYIEARSVPVLK